MVIKTSSAKSFDFFCQNHSSFRTKLALVSFYKAIYPKWIDQILLLLEYLQLISQILLLPDTKYESPSYFSYPFQVIVYFFKIINPSFLLTYENGDATTCAILSLIFICVLTKLALFLYILCVALWDCKKYSLLLLIWRWVFRLQTRGIYFLFTSFWVTAVIKALEDDMKDLPFSKAALISMSIFVILTELLLCFMIDIRLCSVLPDKNYLSSKSNTLTSLTLFQKLMMQLLVMILRSDSQGNAWVISVIGLALNVVRVRHFYTCLPLYYYKALLLQGYLLGITFALNLIYFLNTFLRAIDVDGAGINFIISSWVVFSVLAYQITRESLSKVVMRLLSQNTSENPERLIHKVLMTKELKLNELKPGDMSHKYHLTYLLTMNQSMNLQEIFGVKIRQGELSKKTIQKIYMLFCEELAIKFPQNLFVKLHLAKAYFKNSEPYTKIIKIANEIMKNKWSKEFLSSSLLLYEIEKSMLENCNHGKETERKLDVLTFIRSKLQVEKLKNKILKQIDLSINVCDNITSEVSDIGEIYTSGQLIGKSKQSVQKMMDKLSQCLPEYYVSPYLIYAEYHLILNYSLKKFDRFVEIFAQKYLKNEGFFKETCLVEENLYQDSNVFLLLSSQKNQFGQILFATKSLQDLCGNNSNEYIGTHITSLFPPTLRSFYEDAFKHNFNQGGQNQKNFTNKIHRSYIYHKNKHLIEVDFSLKYHPYLNQNLYLDMIVRKVPKTREFLLVREDGNIEGASKGIFRLLKLRNSCNTANLGRQMVHLRALSEELCRINLAFNMIQQHQHNDLSIGQEVSERKRGSKVGLSTVGDFGEGPSTQRMFHGGESSMRGLKMTYQQALEIHSAFIKEDQKVEIFPFETEKTKKNDRQGYEFYCNVQMISYGPNTLKLLSLQELNDSNDKHSRIFSDPEPERATSINFITESPTRKYTLKDLKDEEEGSENFNVNEREPDDPETVITSFHRPHSPEKIFTTMSPVSQADLPLISVTSENRKFFSDTLFTTYRIDLSPNTPPGKDQMISAFSKRRTLAQIDEGLSSLLSDNPKQTEGGETQEMNILDKKNRVQKYLSSHGSSQKSGEKASNKAFKAAILAKSYPRSFNVLCVVFYGVILLTFISQIIMKYVSDDTMTDLTIKKDLLKYSEQRSYRAMMQVVNVVGGVLEIQGALAVGGAISGLDVVAANLLTHSSALRDANNEMVKNTNALEESIQKKLFQPNVRMYGTYSSTDDETYENMTSFQAAAKLINAAETFAGLDDWVSLAGYNSLYYIDSNTMDDFESECLEITEIFIGSVAEQKQQYQDTTTICLILTPFLLIGIGFLLTVIILNQYRIEKKQMNALIKVRSSEMKEVFDRIKKFQKGLINEEISEYNWFHNITEDLKIVSSLQIEQRVPVYSKKQDDQTIKYKKFRKRYYQYILKVVLYISALVTINIWDWISTKHSTKVIYNLEDQLQFANHVSNRVTVAYTSFALLFTTNNTMLIERKKPLQAMIDGAAETKTLQNEVIYKFQDINGEYNPEVKSIIFDDDPSCSRITGDNYAKCVLLVNTGQPINMISALSVLQNILTNKYQDYENADKSTMTALLTVAYQNIATLLPNFIVIVYEAQYIANIIDEVLIGQIEDIKRNRSWVLGVFSVGLVFVSVLIWFHILKRIREVYNDFKKVLQIFPPGLVLSSYLLKKFLKRTSDRSFLL